MEMIEKMKELIDDVYELAIKEIVKKCAVMNYAGLLDEWERCVKWDMEEAEEIYEQAIERIYGKYVPDADHADTYYGGYDPEPVTFDEIKRLYVEWSIEDDFETFFETWEKAE